ncbi:MAG: coproporphyrinogen III oxidase family protein [Planctomycetota bacterium]|nr:MAG: coproporphyrinogen III oxidase family protein [Planctomycetota bacterium]REJ95436.1 MAG: coproporphyrinogen III oxidase family protein [Planctomycetota bacterium]REK24177.1 MAG: coproporphyrinogen III oxidase family protein [Planctomycetota bacterium]REK28836.1 MAG: coproporphyrinogen III oxidase family protein [Planctomycetota bacterium]
MNRLLEIDDREPLSAYAYSYPHKSSYHRLSPPVLLRDAWQGEDLTKLSLYVHVPFCEMRCGFCNLFTQSQPDAAVVDSYLMTLQRQMQVVRSAVPEARYSQFAIGGGTPTYLTARQLETLLFALERSIDQPIRSLPTSVETSPATATPDRLRILADTGVQRISIGVQSFVESELRDIGRPQNTTRVHEALEAIRALPFPVLNVDLIYGHPEQELHSWQSTVEMAIDYQPEEVYLYPLYVRPQTGLARSGSPTAGHRVELFREARDLLRIQGYVQTSLRCFRLPEWTSPSTYTCQRDGMVGLGCGARSYTRRLHYATRFAVTSSGIKAILRDWIGQSDEELSYATHGIWLSEEEQRRRYLIMSLLQTDGLVMADYEAIFQSTPDAEFPELERLAARGWLRRTEDRLMLTEAGLEQSDQVGPLLYSRAVRARLKEFVRL